jgi:tyrosinase
MATTTKPYAIVGIQDGLAPPENEFREVGVRMEIDTWFESQDLVHINQRALFFPALREFCNKSPNDKLSYFQVAGQSTIHLLSQL